MAKYLITYDYHKDRNYELLYELLNKWNAKRIVESVWFANLNGDAVAVRSALQRVADSDDVFVVIELIKESDWAYSAGVQADGATWLNNNI